ncbi:hypothetical protein C8R44DRAFT_654049 [Mycena epipterygia]|nr:hypothetical protein C8R44DRAFT_654049 [Mycena epipterygia]
MFNSTYPSQPPQFPPEARSSSGIQFTRDADFLIESFLPVPNYPTPPPYEQQKLPLPFCTPQISTKFDAPFARGYNHVLQTSVDLSQEQLLAFLDGLNLAMTSSPPLRVVNFTGMVIGFVPHHWTLIAGNALQIIAETGMHVVSKTLTDRYLRAANLRLFKPRGLSVRLCTTAAMQHLVMRTEASRGPSTLHKIGRGVGTVVLHAPILPFSSRIVRAIADKPPKVHASISAVGDGRTMPLSTQRRLAALEGHALPLQLDVPPPARARGVIDAMAAWGVALETRRAEKKEDKVERWRRDLARIDEQLRRMGVGSTSAGQTQVQAQMGAGPSRERERGGGLISGLIGPKESKLERRVANADLLEHWGSDKVLWVVIMNGELDDEIEGIELAEGLENEEHVHHQAWKSQIVKERDALEEEGDSDSDDEEHHHKR